RKWQCACTSMVLIRLPLTVTGRRCLPTSWAHAVSGTQLQKTMPVAAPAPLRKSLRVFISDPLGPFDYTFPHRHISRGLAISFVCLDKFRASRKDLIKRVLVGALASDLRFDIAESKLAQLELFYEDIDHPNRVVLIDPARRGSCIRPRRPSRHLSSRMKNAYPGRFNSVVRKGSRVAIAPTVPRPSFHRKYRKVMLSGVKSTSVKPFSRSVSALPARRARETAWGQCREMLRANRYPPSRLV